MNPFFLGLHLQSSDQEDNDQEQDNNGRTVPLVRIFKGIVVEEINQLNGLIVSRTADVLHHIDDIKNLHGLDNAGHHDKEEGR